MAKKKLLRSRTNRVLGGVCAGIGDYAGTDPTVIRVLWTLLTAFTAFFPGMLAYIVLWVLVPER